MIPSGESDEDLRARIAYIAGMDRELASARGEDLDAIAWRYGLRRRVDWPDEVTPTWRN